MTTKEQIEIIEAYERGEEIEIKSAHRDWTIIGFKYPTIYCFNFQDFDYRIKPKRWRAEKDNCYYYLLTTGDVSFSDDFYGTIDEKRYSIGNYFRTKEQAERARELLAETLIKFNEND